MKYETIFRHLQATLAQAVGEGRNVRQIFASASAKAQDLMGGTGSGMHGTRGLRPNNPFRIEVRGLLGDRFLRVALQHRHGDVWETRALAFLDAQGQAPFLYTARAQLLGGGQQITRPSKIKSHLPEAAVRLRDVLNRQADDWEREVPLAA
jgi:hypothetical protein